LDTKCYLPKLFDSPRSVEYRARFGPAFAPILQLTVGHVPQILSEHSVETFREKRKLRWGKSVEQWVEEHPIQEGLAIAEPRIKELGDWLDAVPGPFVNGDSPGYADFNIAALIAFVKAVGLTDAFEAVLGFHPAIRRLYDAVGLTQTGNVWSQYLFEDSK
jgi:glutathione S-transferase